MPAIKRNIVIEQGADFILPLQLYADAAKTQLRDLTGYTAKMQIKRAYDSATAIFDKSTSDPEITIDIATAVVQIQIPGDQTAAMPANFQGEWDIVLFGPTSSKERLMMGACGVSPGITK